MYVSKLKLLVPALLVAALGACDNPVEHDDDHEEATGVVVTDLAGVTLATYTPGSWTVVGGDALHLHPGEELGVKIFFLAEDGDRFQLPHTGADHTLRVQIANESVVEYHAHGDHGDFDAIAVGETTAKIQLYHGGHADFETTGLTIEVADDH